jgi:CelD/BcsL family acetyltransferase involved in cellulose biosynthesis
MADSAFAAMTAHRAMPIGTSPAARMDMGDVPRGAWQALCGKSIEPNAFFDPGFSTPALTLASGKGARALVAFDGANRSTIVGLLPVFGAWQAYRLPVPALVASQPYSPLATPLLDRDHAVAAAGALIDGAAAAGAHLLVLPFMTLEGPAAMAIEAALTERGLKSLTDNEHARAAFEATSGDVDDYLRSGMGAKRLKEIRRLRNRLADDGEIAFSIARTPDAIAPALDRFLDLESRGWKGEGGTGLAQARGAAAFIRAAANDLGARGAFEIVELTLDRTTIASGLVMMQADRAFFFKIAYDETMGRFSPGVQLTLELTRRFAEDESIALADSTANAGHPMIDHVWRERLAVGDLLVPTRRGDPAGSAIAKLIMARRHAREEAKRLVKLVKNIREKRS